MKKIGKSLILMLLLALCATALWGCSLFQLDSTKVKVTGIILAKSEVAVASYGDNTTAQIYPMVYPENAENKKVIFLFKNIDDTEFVAVTDTGLITGRKEKTDGTVEIVIKSVANPEVTASVFVTIEDKAVENIYFSPNTRRVYTDQKSFTVKAFYLPAHAAEGTVLSYTSNNPDVATVDAFGAVTLIKRGTAHIVASNSDEIKGYLELIVQCPPPSYLLEETPSAQNAYNQVPGSPIPITYTLIPGLNNDPKCNIRWYAESKEIVESRDKLTFTYTPSKEIVAHVYNVEVTVTDSDNQIQKIISKDINIYNRFTGVQGIEIDTTPEYFISDEISVLPILNQDEQRPESYHWYVHVLKDNESEDILQDIANYTLVGVSQYKNKKGAFTYVPTKAGQIVLAMVPILNGTEYKDKMVRTKAFTVNLLETGSPFYRASFSSVMEGETPLLKLNWGFMPGETTFIIELTRNGEKTFISSDNPVYSARFTETSFVFPADLATPSGAATVRIRTDRYGYGAAMTYTSGAAESKKELTNFDSPIEGLPFTYYIKSISQMGDILNYIRFFRPGQDGNAAVPGITYRRDTGVSASNPNIFSFEVAFAFNFEDVDISKYDKTKAPFNVISKNYYMTEADVISGLTNSARYLISDYNEAIDKIFSAFLAYGESGRVNLSVAPRYFGTTGDIVSTKKGTFPAPITEVQSYSVIVSTYVRDEPTTIYESPQTLKKDKINGAYDRTLSSKPRGAGYDGYFQNNRGTMSVRDGQQLYLAALWGYKPIPVAGSVAETIYNEAKNVLNRILGSDIPTEQEKVCAIYDWLTWEVDYDYNLNTIPDADSSSEGFCLDGVFLRNYAVCDGLSKAFVLLSAMEGIVSFKISGWASGGHAWNKVLVNGAWFLIDTTWGGTYIPDAAKPNVTQPVSLFLLKKEGAPGFKENVDRMTYGEFPEAK